MKLRRILMLAVLVLFAFGVAACSEGLTIFGVTISGTPDSGATVAEPVKLPDTVEAATVKALQDNPNVVLLDVREPSEYAAGHIPGITLIPMGQVADRLAEIPKDKTVILTCRSGNRSGQVADYLRQQGYTDVHNMQGGIIAWEQAGYPIEK